MISVPLRIIQENSRLKYVNLSHNEFSDNAAAVLGQAIGTYALKTRNICVTILFRFQEIRV